MKGRMIKVATALLTCVVLTCCVLGIFAVSALLGKTTLRIDTNEKLQTMQGFGASSAWVYQDLGLEDLATKNTAIQMLYGNDGLQLNTFRYNVGAGGVESDNYKDPLRGAQSFFIAERFTGDYSVFADADNYDFTRDGAVLDLFKRALATGNIDKVIFFANSPHYLMTKNGKTHGDVPYDNNLKEECYVAFSQYMLVIVNYIYQNIISQYDKDIQIYISPVNEPQWKWGDDATQEDGEATQEGCHYDPKPLAKFYDTFYSQLDVFNDENSTDFHMDIFESGNYKMLNSTRTKFNEYMREFEKYDFFDEITHISLHSYGADKSIFYREIFADYMSKNFPHISISMSEYCTMEWNVDESIDMGLWCGKVMMRDIAILGVTDWSYWLSVAKGGYEDALVYWKKDNGYNSFEVTKRYYVFGQFSKYISNGSVRVSADYSDFLGVNGIETAAFKNPDGSVTVIVLNDSEKSHTIALKGVDKYKNVKEIMTDSDVNWQTREYAFDGNVKVAAKSMTTFVLTK